MEENPVAHQGLPDEAYHKLGPKTLMVSVLQHIQAPMVLLIGAVVAFASEGQPFLKTADPKQDLTPYVNIAAWSLLGLCVGIFAITFFFLWLLYKNYKFALSDNALKIKRGILNKEEVSIPYRQIQDVDIDRDLGFQMMGLSRITILTAGQDDQKLKDGESEGILPALDKDLAEWLQTELLKRANVQKVIETK